MRNKVAWLDRKMGEIFVGVVDLRCGAGSRNDGGTENSVVP